MQSPRQDAQAELPLLPGPRESWTPQCAAKRIMSFNLHDPTSSCQQLLTPEGKNHVAEVTNAPSSQSCQVELPELSPVCHGLPQSAS